ncbi:DUF2242 domain-containing protein [Bordetella muralis]|uniref:DUF2242 domain-containing protein n=1 Tax=Bordetella muralis TaxID=1649130 RepID=UPI0039EE1086
MRFPPLRLKSTQYSSVAGRAGLLASVVLLAACAPTPTIDERDSFTQETTYSHRFAGTSSQAACEAGRRALLGQGYIIDKAEPNQVSGHKNYQDKENDNQHGQILFNVNCTTSGSGEATVYANALRELYTMKRSSNSASVGLSVLGSVSMPLGASDDSLVKTSSETISRGVFYEGFFQQLEQNLTSAKAAIDSGTTPGQNPKAAGAAAKQQIDKPGLRVTPPQTAPTQTNAPAPTQPAKPAAPTPSTSSPLPSATTPVDTNAVEPAKSGATSPSAQPAPTDASTAPASGTGSGN